MSHCIHNTNTPSISVTLKDYESGCQCIPAPPTSCPIPPPCPPSHPPKFPTADQLTTARKISLTGDASGSVYFDGSSDVDISVDIPSISNIEIDDLMNGEAEDGSQAFLDSNGVLFLLEKIKSLIEEETSHLPGVGELTDEQIAEIFGSVEIIHGGDADGDT